MAKREDGCRHVEEKLALKEKHAQAMVEIMRGVVRDVFSNNKFKYSVRDTQVVAVPGHAPQSGCDYAPYVHKEDVDRTVEGET